MLKPISLANNYWEIEIKNCAQCWTHGGKINLQKVDVMKRLQRFLAIVYLIEIRLPVITF